MHLAEGYHLSRHSGRKERVRDMLEALGTSVLSGACTTMGAALFMFFGQIQFFLQFGAFLLSVIGFSLLFSLGFFTTTMAIIGPQGETGSLIPLFRYISKCCSQGQSGIKNNSGVQPMNADTKMNDKSKLALNNPLCTSNGLSHDQSKTDNPNSQNSVHELANIPLSSEKNILGATEEMKVIEVTPL